MIEYDFKAESITDYTLTFEMVANNKMFKRIFASSKAKLKRKGVDAGNPELIDKFEIPHKYHNLLLTILNKQVKHVSKEVKADGIIILNSAVEYAEFRRNSKRDWNVKIKIGGQYSDER